MSNRDGAIITTDDGTSVGVKGGATKVKESGASSITCPMLTATNYVTWATRMKIALRINKVWEVIEKGSTDPDKNDIALGLLFQSISETLMLQVNNLDTAKAVWEAIKIRHVGADRVREARLQTLMSQFDRISMKETESIDEFAGRLSEIFSKSASLGEVMEESKLVKKFLKSLPRKKYIHIVASLEQVLDLNTTSYEDIVGRLKAYEERIHEEEEVDDQNKLMYTNMGSHLRNNGGNYERNYGGRDYGGDSREGRDYGRGRDHDGDSRGRGRGRGRGWTDRSKITCFRCDKLGHFAAECPDRLLKLQEAQEADDTQEADDLMMHEIECFSEKDCVPSDNTTHNDEEDIWYLDNGASNHMTRDRRYFIGIDETISGKVRLGDNSRIDIKGRGTISFVDQDGENRTMCDVYFIPKLKSNIVSLGKVTELGYEVRMKGEDLIIHDQEGKQVVKTRRSKNHLYKIRMRLTEMTPEHKSGQKDVINMSKNSGENFSEYSTHVERPSKWNHLISSSHEEVMNFAKQMISRSTDSDLRALFGMKRSNENELSCKLTWYGIWVHNRRFEKWNHVKSRSYEKVMGSTNQPTSDFADLDLPDLFEELRLEQKELGYKPNYYGIMAHQERSEIWNHIKRRSDEGVMNFSIKCILDLFISEIEQFKGNRVCALKLVEFLHKNHSRMMKSNMEPWSMKIEAYRLGDPRKKNNAMNCVVFIENEAWKWDEIHDRAVGGPERVEEERGGDRSETEDVEVMVEENPERSRSKYLNDNVLFVEYVGLLCLNNEKLRNRDEAEAKFEGDEEDKNGDGAEAKSEELRNHERAEESEKWTKAVESEKWTEEIEIEDIEEVNFKLKGENVGVSFKLT